MTRFYYFFNTQCINFKPERKHKKPKNNRTAYNELLFSGRLNRYLAELGEQAEKMLALLTEQYAAAENVTEEMKAADQMGWVRAMNSIRNRAEEVVLSELVYC